MPHHDHVTLQSNYTAESPAPIEGLPPGFDPCAQPVIAQHFYGVAVLPRQNDDGVIEVADVGEAA